MRIKQILLIVLGALAVMLTSCNNDSFQIDGTVAGLQGAVVKVLFEGDSCIVDEWADVDKKGHFSYTGTSTQPVMVTLLSAQGDHLMTVVAVNGDHLKLKGDAAAAMSFKVKGSKVNEDWQLFRDEHQAFYTDPNPSRLDAAIEKYVREHPSDMLSTVLLMADYSDFTHVDKVRKMLNGIDVKARPQSLTRAFTANHLMKRNPDNLPRLMTLNLVTPRGNFEEINLMGKMTLISLWANPQNDRKASLRALAEVDDGSASKFQVIDILAEGDTLRWRSTIAADPEAWKHYWAPGGPLEQGIQLLGINSMPWFAVTDSTGMVTYNGSDLNAAIEAAALH